MITCRKCGSRQPSAIDAVVSKCSLCPEARMAASEYRPLRSPFVVGYYDYECSLEDEMTHDDMVGWDIGDQ